mmetsp:Transcript_4380/g.9489  ORF Transcript_4380/g.9489 Transcript_4380/m.9489 type:complete len:210 (-) Transcript_4380:793-1422(-)
MARWAAAAADNATRRVDLLRASQFQLSRGSFDGTKQYAADRASEELRVPSAWLGASAHLDTPPRPPLPRERFSTIRPSVLARAPAFSAACAKCVRGCRSGSVAATAAGVCRAQTGSFVLSPPPPPSTHGGAPPRDRLRCRRRRRQRVRAHLAAAVASTAAVRTQRSERGRARGCRGCSAEPTWLRAATADGAARSTIRGGTLFTGFQRR